MSTKVPSPSPADIRKQRAVITAGIRMEEKRYEEALQRWEVLMSDIQDRCPHANIKSGSYSRWCTDCGKDWDTT